MGHGEDVVAFLHDGSTNGMAITIFGSLKPIPKNKRTPSRIPISVINPYHYENERDTYSEKQRGINHSTRNKDRELFGQNYDARFLNNIKKITNRIKSSYSCNQELCPMIKERIDRHQTDKHPLYHHDKSCGKINRDIDRRTDPTSARVLRPYNATLSGPNFKDTQSIQTNIKDTDCQKHNNHYNNNNKLPLKLKAGNAHNFNDYDSDTRPNKYYNFNDNRINESRTNRHKFNDNLYDMRPDTNYLKNNDSDDNNPLKRTETRELIAPKRNIYKDYVDKEVREWFQEVPVYPNLEEKNNFNKNDLINNLTEKINNLSPEFNNEGYDRKIANNIDDFLNSIPMWYPGAKRDQELFKNTLNDNLLNRIKDLNKQILTGNNDTHTKENTRKSIHKYSHSYNRESSRSPSFTTFSSKHSINTSDEIEEAINNWLLMIKFKKCALMPVNKLSKVLMKRIAPLLNKPRNTCSYKHSIKCAIVDLLNDLPIGAKCSRSNLYLHRFADDLTNIILDIQAKAKHNNTQPNIQCNAMYQTNENLGPNKTKNAFEDVIYREIDKCLANTRYSHINYVKIKITNIFMDYVDSTVSIEFFNVQKEILKVLKGASNIPEFLALKIVQNIIREVKNALNQVNNIEVLNKPKITRKISVYTSEEKSLPTNYPITSTPKKNKLQKTIVSKLNPEEIKYAEQVGDLIRAWMGTLPEQFNAPEERNFKDTMIKDLAGDITDAAKLEQLATVDEKEKWLKYLVYKWLHKLDVFDLEEVIPQIEDLLKKLKDIPVPVLIRPQGGNRQAMANIQHMEGELGWKKDFVPKGKDILEDEISIWMNEQPTDIFEPDRNTRNNKICELAEILQDKLASKCPEKEITNDVAQWLKNILNTEQKSQVSELANDLKGRIVNLPQDATLAANLDKKLQQKAEKIDVMSPKTSNNETENIDNTMQEFIAKFIEHNYDIDDPMARGAFNHLLKTKLQRLNPPTRKEVYDDFGKSDHLSRKNLIKELEYIKDVSDWLKNIPIEAGYNTVGNRKRRDFVNDLAKSIFEVEEQREVDPEAMDYNMYMASIISQFLVLLPIIEEYKNEKNMMFMIDQLIGKVILHRNKEQKHDSVDTSGIHDENLGDFLEEFIRVNGSEIADDEIKLEAWTARLMTEIKKMVHANDNPTILSKAHVYNRLTNVPLPNEESIKQFENEIEYIKEISEWVKNLPLLPIDKTDEEERINMICGLAQKITERNSKQSDDTNDTGAEAEFEEYVSKWISDLSLDDEHEVLVDVVIKQLINRIDRMKTSHEKPNNRTDLKINKKQSHKSIKAPKIKPIKNPAGAIVDAIDKWSASLPIKADDEKSVQSMKYNAAKKLYQTVGELSIDPRTLNDDLLYQDILADEVDAVFEKLPQTPELQNNKDKLKTEIVQTVVEAQKSLKENYAGEFYKQKLEHTIDASIPHPIKGRQAYNPGFEIYKTRLADMFILENFDHANDAVKVKYERRVKDEIDKYYDSVKNKNVIPLTKDEIYNELYSALFKVPMPNESSVMGEVEEIKTRCEIDAWYEELPLKNASGLIELLKIDKILASLAKRIHDIEKNESKPADKIHKEIMKWLLKLPLLSKQESDLKKYAKKLQDTLKSSVNQRKCVVTDPKSKKGKSKTKTKDKAKAQKDESQIPGPSTDGQIWESQVKHGLPKKKAAEMIIKIVEDWCNQLPISTTTHQEEEEANMMRETLSTKILMKIGELNMNYNNLNDDFYYDNMLDEELDKLLSDIPTCCNFEESRAARKIQLKDAIKSVKPLFREEKARHQYKQNLDKTVANVLGKPQDTTADKEAEFNDLKEEIVENFVQYTYDRDDDERRQAYKIKVHDAVLKFLSNVAESKDETLDALKRRNQLLCELAKIPIPSENSMKEEVEVIRMKNEISEFFEDQSISDKNKRLLINQVKLNLAKKLNDIELNGHNPKNDEKMKREIEKSLKKLNKEVKSEKIDNFVNKLKDTEIIRRAPPTRQANTNCKKHCKIGRVCFDNALQVNSKSKTQIQDSCGNLQGSTKKRENTKKDDCKLNLKNSKSRVECECHKYKNPQSEGSADNLEAANDSGHDSKTSLDCCSKNEFLLEERQASDSLEDTTEKEDDGKCIYCDILRKSRRGCYMPMKWNCNRPDIPFCRMPARYFYY